MSIALSAKNVVITRRVLMYQRIRSNSLMTSEKSKRNAEGNLFTMRTITKLYCKSGGRPLETRRAIRKRAIRSAQRYMRTCRKVGVEMDTTSLVKCAMSIRSASLLSLVVIKKWVFFWV